MCKKNLALSLKHQSAFPPSIRVKKTTHLATFDSKSCRLVLFKGYCSCPQGIWMNQVGACYHLSKMYKIWSSIHPLKLSWGLDMETEHTLNKTIVGCSLSISWWNTEEFEIIIKNIWGRNTLLMGHAQSIEWTLHENRKCHCYFMVWYVFLNKWINSLGWFNLLDLMQAMFFSKSHPSLPLTVQVTQKGQMEKVNMLFCSLLFFVFIRRSPTLWKRVEQVMDEVVSEDTTICFLNILRMVILTVVWDWFTISKGTRTCSLPWRTLMALHNSSCGDNRNVDFLQRPLTICLKYLKYVTLNLIEPN